MLKQILFLTQFVENVAHIAYFLFKVWFLNVNL